MSLRGPAFLMIAAALAAGGCMPATTPAPSAASTAAVTATAAGSTAQPAVTEAPQAEHRIGVRQVAGDGEFYDRLTGDRWVPRGMNLVRLDGFHVVLNPGHYDPAAFDSSLARMASSGYNVVRLFMDHRVGGLSDDQGRLSGAYLDNIVDALARAKARGMQLILTQDWNPDGLEYGFGPDPDIEDVNSVYLARGGLESTRSFYREFVQGLVDRRAAFDALWAYELRNELHFSQRWPPFSLTSGEVRAANGRTYDMALADDRIQMLEDGLVHWFDDMRATILALDPTALVTVGFFEPQGPNPSRIGDDKLIETGEVIRRSTADFIDLHAYPGGSLVLRQIVENFKLPPVTSKPIVLGEFGAEHGRYPDLDDTVRTLVDWQVESCAYGFDGWLFWSWDPPAQPEFWKATDEDGAIEQALAPAVRPDPCTYGPYDFLVNLALDATAKASRATADAPASLAIDGSPATSWLAGAGPTQWIQVDLGAVRQVDEIRLQVAMYPPGAARHVVYVGTSAGALDRVAVFDEALEDGQVLVVRPEEGFAGIRFVRIETTRSVSDVAWAEISVLGRHPD